MGAHFIDVYDLFHSTTGAQCNEHEVWFRVEETYGQMLFRIAFR